MLFGATALVSQAYAPYIHQISPSISTARASPAAPVCSPITAVSWVIVNTNTRSKNSSSVETRTGASASSATRAFCSTG